MKKLMVTAAAVLWSQCAMADEMRLAVTTSFDNSGLSEVLLPAIKADLDIDLQLLVVGTGQALKLGEAGDVDAVLVHSRPLKTPLSRQAMAHTVVKSCITILS